MKWGKQVSNTGKKCQLTGEENIVFLPVFIHLGVSLLVSICVESEKKMEKVNKCEALLGPISNHTSKKCHFEISKSVISIQAYCLLFTQSSYTLPPSTQINLSGLTICWSNRGKQIIENRRQTGMVRKHKVSCHFLIAARVKRCVSSVCLVIFCPLHISNFSSVVEQSTAFSVQCNVKHNLCQCGDDQHERLMDLFK